MIETFERVYTVTDYWDGPREGLADYGGAPHVYRSIWLRDREEWDDDRFFLCPVTAEEARLVLEDWAMWHRFAEHSVVARLPVPETQADWGALPEDLHRHRELRLLLVPILALDRSRCIIAHAKFRLLGPPQVPGFILPRIEVQWRLADPQPDDELLASPIS